MASGEPVCPRCGQAMTNGSEHLNCVSTTVLAALLADVERLERERDAARAEAARLREALAYYAYPNRSIGPDGEEWESLPGPERARAALEAQP